MTLGTLLEMATYEHHDRVLVGSHEGGLTGADLAQRAAAGARLIRDRDARHVAFVGVNSPAVPVTVLAAALAGVPVTPINYRLASEPLRELLERLPQPLVVTDPAFIEAIGVPAHGVGVLPTPAWLELTAADPAPGVTLPEVDVDSCAIMLFTSGTTSAPKGVLLRHAHLTSYVLQTVEFGSADADDATLVSVPPYHVAGIGTVLSNLYAGRRVTYLSDFTAEGWMRTVADERITNAMLVPTMLVRIVEHLNGAPAEVPTLRSVAYGGARLPRAVLENALAAFPKVGFTNAYGLTETSSTIAVLGPDDHRAAMASSDPGIQARLGSAGRVVPGVEAQIRDSEGTVLPAGETGELWVRGAQVSGEYSEAGSVLDTGGWFPTRDRARLDDAGYLFIEGRTDDTIIRGGENISPAEIEEVLAAHPDVADIAVFGAPDDHWGDRIVAAIVTRAGSVTEPERYRNWVRERLRSSRTPDQILFVAELPYTATGKLLRRELIKSATDEIQNKPSAAQLT